MVEFIALFVFFYLIFNSFAKRKAKRKPRSLDAELKHLIHDSSDSTAISLEIKRYLLDLINDDKSGAEKFATVRIDQAQHILDRAGPAAMYWVTEIAAQLSILSAAQINGLTTNVSAELGENATPEAVIDIVIKN